MRFLLIFFLCIIFLFASFNVQASIIISEILADPAPGIAGDANNDGVGSSYDDEMVELYNSGYGPIDISGWYISDSVSKRHLFPGGSILPSLNYIAVFGGGLPDLDDILWQISSTGSLGLNNPGDIVSLFDPQGLLVDQVVYGSEGSHDQSIVLEILEKESDFILHSQAQSSSGRLFSPGTAIDGSIYDIPTVPEPCSLYYLLMGFSTVLFIRIRMMQ